MKKQVRESCWTPSIIAALCITLLSVQGIGSCQMAAITVEQPSVLIAVTPVFPATAVATNTSGTVLIEVEMNAAGEVTSTRSVSGHPLLRKSAENAARRWRFTSTANARTRQLTFAFRLLPKDTPPEELTSVFTPPYQVEVRHQPYEPIIHSDPRSDERRTRQRKRKRIR